MQVIIHGDTPKMTDLEKHQVDVLYEHWLGAVKSFYANPRNREKFDVWVANGKPTKEKTGVRHEQMRMAI